VIEKICKIFYVYVIILILLSRYPIYDIAPADEPCQMHIEDPVSALDDNFFKQRKILEESKSFQKENVVYVTRTGTKYHKAGCRYLKKKPF